MNFEITVTEKKSTPKQEDAGPFEIFLYAVFMFIVSVICK